MLLNLYPVFGVDYWIGDCMFTRTPGSFLSDNIVDNTYPEDYAAGVLMASHVGGVESATDIVEAWSPDVRRWPLRNYFQDQETLIWFKRPLGQTQESALALAKFMASHVGEDYDESALIGLALTDNDDKSNKPNRLADRNEWFCSQLYTQALLETETLRMAALPETFKYVHPTWRTPEGLNRSPIWEPGRIKGKPISQPLLADIGGSLAGV